MITSLTKHRADDAERKVLTCVADGVPEPSFRWSVNSTSVSVRACMSKCMCLISSSKEKEAAANTVAESD